MFALDRFVLNFFRTEWTFLLHYVFLDLAVSVGCMIGEHSFPRHGALFVAMLPKGIRHGRVLIHGFVHNTE